MKLTIHLACLSMCLSILSNAQQVSYPEEFTRLIERCDSLIYDQPQKSLEYAQIAFDVATESKNDSLIALALNRIGSSHWSLGNSLEALEKIQASLQLSESNELESIIAKNLGNIGNVYAASGLDLDAIGYYKSELEVQKSVQDTFRMFAIYNNIGKAFLGLGYYDSARHYLRGVEPFLNPQFEHLFSLYFFNLAELNFEEQKFDQADSLLKLTWENANAFNSGRGIIRANQLQAEYDMAMGKPNDAYEFAKTGYDLAVESGVKELIYLTSKTLSRSHGMLNEFEEAYKYEQLHEQYLDSVQNVTTVNELELLSYYQRLFQVRVLESRNELNMQLAEQRQLIINGLMVVLIMATILIAVIFYFAMKIRKQKKELEQLNQFKAKIFAIVSHDLKSPIQSVSSVIEMFNRKLIEKEEIEPYLPEVKEKTSNLMNLLNNVFHWAEGQMEGEKLRKEDFPVRGVIDDLELELGDRLKDKEIQLKYDSAFGFYIHSNKGIIRILLRNLLVNAIKFSNAKSTIEINCVEGEKTKIIEVIDQGIGMSKQTKDRLFSGDIESTEGTSGEQGNGLGLVLCNDFVRGLGGSMEVKVSLEKGLFSG